VQVIQYHFECKMPSRANLPTEDGPCWVSGEIKSYPCCDHYCHEPNKGELLFKILVYEFEHMTKNGRMCVIMISFSQPGFMGAKVQ